MRLIRENKYNYVYVSQFFLQIHQFLHVHQYRVFRLVRQGFQQVLSFRSFGYLALHEHLLSGKKLFLLLEKSIFCVTYTNNKKKGENASRQVIRKVQQSVGNTES